MKINKPDFDIDVNKIKKTAKEAAKNAVNTAQNLKENAKTTAKNVKNAVDDFSKQAEQKAEDLKQAYIRVFNKPKLEKLSEDITNLKYKILAKDVELRKLKEAYDKDGAAIYKAEKDMLLLQEKLSQITAQYNEFAAKQAACQKVFEELNK